jgi:hypothetical protein
MAVIGLTFRVVVPGAGALAIDAGRGVFDETGLVFVSGRHDIVTADSAALCDYLAGG